jgi:hypothetical protein
MARIRLTAKRRPSLVGELWSCDTVNRTSQLERSTTIYILQSDHVATMPAVVLRTITCLLIEEEVVPVL